MLTATLELSHAASELYLINYHNWQKHPYDLDKLPNAVSPEIITPDFFIHTMRESQIYFYNSDAKNFDELKYIMILDYETHKYDGLFMFISCLFYLPCDDISLNSVISSKPGDDTEIKYFGQVYHAYTPEDLDKLNDIDLTPQQHFDNLIFAYPWYKMKFKNKNYFFMDLI